MKITLDTIKAMQKGIPTKELEILKESFKDKPDFGKVKEKMSKSDNVSIEDIDLDKMKGFNGSKKAPEVSVDAITKLLSGKSARQIMSEGSVFVEPTNGLENIVKEGVNLNKPVLNESFDSQPTAVNISKEEITEIVYGVLAEILDMSNEKAKDGEYVKKTLSEVYTFIKLKESFK